MGIRTYGLNAVDWEERIDLERLRRQRLARLKEALDRSELLLGHGRPAPHSARARTPP